MSTRYYAEVIYRTGQARFFNLSEGTWTLWGGLCALNNQDNAFAKGSVLGGLTSDLQPICVRMTDISSIIFKSEKPSLVSSIRALNKTLGGVPLFYRANPLECDSHYDNPLS